MKTVAFHNLGCKVNSYEMEVMRQYFQKNGYSIVDFAQKSDIYIINTCTVTNIADRKSRQMIHRAKALNPDALVVAVGCFVQTHKDEIEQLDGIDLAVGNNHKKDIVALVEEFLESRQRGDVPEKTLGGRTVTELGRGCGYEELKLDTPPERTRVFIKIQDGCDQFCSYCAIPYARGRVRSRNSGDILEEAKKLAEQGCREIVLTGIHISSYGLDFSGQTYNRTQDGGALLLLTKELAGIDGITGIRLSSLEPRIITEGFAAELSKNEKVCPHFHLSLQSGCDSVLSRMNRHYTCEDFSNSVKILRRFYDMPAITTDIIAGFPGETEEEFEQTLRFVESIGFYETHIFPYSRRKGTVADRMQGQLTEKVKKERAARLIELGKRQSRRYMEAFTGRQVNVLFETTTAGGEGAVSTGHTPNYLEVTVPGEQKAGDSAVCRITGFDEKGMLMGRLEKF